MLRIREKLGQEEIIGFAVIVVIVTIILIFFLVFSLHGSNQVQSYESSSFLQSSMQYTSACESNFDHLSVQDLISACYSSQTCDNGKDACTVLNETLNSILDKSWQVGPDFPVKGYEMNISSVRGYLFLAEKGNITATAEGAQQIIPKSGVSIQVLFNKYS